MSERRVVRTLRVGADEIARIMHGMDGAGRTGCGESKRGFRRWQLRGGVAVLSVVDGGGRRTNYVVEPRNLSGTGFGALHGTFVHPGTPCSVGLYRLDGRVASVQGEVARCRLLSVGVYELGVRFEERIDPMGFVAYDGEQMFQVERVDIDSLSGSVLFVSSSRVEQGILADCFDGTPIEFMCAQDGDAASDMLLEAPSLIYVDHAADDWMGLFVVQRLREMGASQPILVLTADHNAAFREDAASVGADEVLTKPVPKEMVLRATAEYLERRRDSSEGASSHFTEVSAEKMGLSFDLLQMFVERLREVAVDIEGAIQADDRETLRKRALEVFGQAGSIGFAAVGRAAEALLEALAAEDSDAVFDAASRLRGVCGHCRAVA